MLLLMVMMVMAGGGAVRGGELMRMIDDRRACLLYLSILRSRPPSHCLLLTRLDSTRLSWILRWADCDATLICTYMAPVVLIRGHLYMYLLLLHAPVNLSFNNN